MNVLDSSTMTLSIKGCNAMSIKNIAQLVLITLVLICFPIGLMALEQDRDQQIAQEQAREQRETMERERESAKEQEQDSTCRGHLQGQFDYNKNAVNNNPCGPFPLNKAIPSITANYTPKNITSFLTSCTGVRVTPNPRQVQGQLVFTAAGGAAQIDPQIAVGGNAVISVINFAITLYSKEGAFITGGSTSCLNLDFDPKIFFDPIGKRFVLASMSFAGSVRVSFSKTSDPRGGWWAYTLPCPGWVDGGAVGASKKWVAYSYPSSNGQCVFLFDRQNGEDGAVISASQLTGLSNPGQPVFTFDTAQENLYFVKTTGSAIQLSYIGPDGALKTLPSVNTGLSLSYPTPFSQKGSSFTCSAGDVNAKMAVLRNGYIWVGHAATDRSGGVTRTTARFYQIDLTGKVIQTAAIDDPTGSVFSGQVTIAVNKNNDVLLVFQQSGKNMYISSCMSYRLATDPLNTLRPVVKHVDGMGVNGSSAAWGDYSGASVDGDNDVDLWGINSVASSSGQGNTAIFKLPLNVSSAHPSRDGAGRFNETGSTFAFVGNVFHVPANLQKYSLSISLFNISGRKIATASTPGHRERVVFKNIKSTGSSEMVIAKVNVVR